MYLHKINDEQYVNLDLVTCIYWSNKNNNWCCDVVGQDCDYPTYILTEEEKNNLVRGMELHGRR